MAITWTTPTLELSVSDVDLTDMEEVIVSFRQGQVVQDYKKSESELTISVDGENSKVLVSMEQRGSGAFQAGIPVEVQVNWLVNGGRMASDVAVVTLERNVYKKVMV